MRRSWSMNFGITRLRPVKRAPHTSTPITLGFRSWKKGSDNRSRVAVGRRRDLSPSLLREASRSNRLSIQVGAPYFFLSQDNFVLESIERRVRPKLEMRSVVACKGMSACTDRARFIPIERNLLSGIFVTSGQVLGSTAVGGLPGRQLEGE